MSETIGQQLKQAREARNLTFKQVTQSTHIQARLIEAMEADDFEALPSPVQARAFLRLYAEYLNLSLEYLITRQRDGTGEPSTSLKIPELTPIQNQGIVKDSKVAATTGSITGTQKDKNLDNLQGKIKKRSSRSRQSLSQPKIPPLYDESATQIISSESEVINNEPVDDERGVEEQLPDEPREHPLPDKIPAEPLSQTIFTSIGKTLQERREALSLTLDEIEDHTHVRKHYLLALEVGNFGHLPSPVQTRGMLNNYAHFLDLDVDAILLQFAEGLQTQRLERQPQPVQKKFGSGAKKPSKTMPLSGLRRYLSMDVLVGVGLVVVLIVFATWGTSRVIGLRSNSTPLPTAQPISDILATTPNSGTVVPEPTNASGAGVIIPTETSTAIMTITAAGQGPVQVVLVALEQAFVRVTVDGKKQFDGRVTAGTVYSYDGNTQIEVLTGNGAAISILFNQSDLGPMGSIGEVVDRIYTANAILNPTATVTPSPTITPTPTITPRPSATPLPGSTTQTPTATQGQG